MVMGHGFRVFLCWTLIVLMASPPHATAGDSVFGGWAKKSRPKTRLEQLAEAVDKLEKEIDCYGSVVIKQPDIWGEARWTSQRQEFEQTMKDELGKFRFTLNAQISEADTTFALMAASLSSAASGTTVIQADSIQGIQEQRLIPIEARKPTVLGFDDKPVAGITVEPTVYLDQMARYIKHLHQLRRVNEGDDTADAAGYALNLVRLPASILPGSKTRTGYGAELTVTFTHELSEDLLPETFKDLVFNDLVDQLSLPLLRVAEAKPWESKPDLELEAEIKKEHTVYKETICALEKSIQTPSENINNLAAKILDDNFGCGLEDSIENIDIKYRERIRNSRIQTVNSISGYFLSRTEEPKNIHSYIRSLRDSAQLYNEVELLVSSLNSHSNQEVSAEVIKRANEFQKTSNPQKNTTTTIPSDDIKNVSDLFRVLKLDEIQNRVTTRSQTDSSTSEPTATTTENIPSRSSNNDALRLISNVEETTYYKGVTKEVSNEISKAIINISTDRSLKISDEIKTIVNSSFVFSGNSRISKARYSIPPTQLVCVFGEENLKCLSLSISEFKEASQQKELHIFDVQGFLGEELEAAYQYLRHLDSHTPYNAWYSLCPDINQAIRLLKFDYVKGEKTLCELRQKFEACIAQAKPSDSFECPPECPPSLSNGPRFCESRSGEKQADECKADKVKPCTECKTCTTKALAWAILVDSALLNSQLFDDIQRVQKSKQIYFAPEHAPPFYGTNPCSEARQCFNEYVKARWPIHVFALDPEVQEQNVSDAYARRRETQLALAMAFAGGEIGARTFSRFARQTDFHLETISLNRTVVGFSHGNDTFGWRFYPRVQTPPTPGNLKAGWQSWVSGAPSRDDDLKCRQLEPGPRELLAVVVMPSFVPYVRVDSRSNWFKLTDPKRKEFTTQDSVRMGHMIQYIHNSKEICLNENHMYRPGDVTRVMTAVNQLEKRLPLQDTLAQIPHENDLGGYRLFALGKRNLGPELIGFYGEPGINLEGDTNLFLVGRGFNVNTTKVIAGGQECVPTLLSREVMKVTIKKGAYTTPVVIKDENGNGVEKPHVDIHVATPYGVSGHLFVPTNSKPTSSPAVTFSQDEVYGCIQYNQCKASLLTLAVDNLKINAPQFKDQDAIQAKIRMAVIFADGSERALSLNAQLSEMTLPGSKGSISVPEKELKNFFQGPTNFSSLQQPIALRVTGSVQQGKETVAIARPLLIKVATKQAPTACCPETQKMIFAIPLSLMNGAASQ